jgi:hypothetical protein
MEVKTCSQISEHPEEDCESDSDALKLIPKASLDIIIADKYLDLRDFGGSPIKTHINYEYRPLTSYLKGSTIYKMKKVDIII